MRFRKSVARNDITLIKSQILMRILSTVILRSLAHYGAPKKILCTFGEKEHTNKRVSVIACDNAISKVQCATW